MFILYFKGQNRFTIDTLHGWSLNIQQYIYFLLNKNLLNWLWLCRIDGEHQASFNTVLNHTSGIYQIGMWVYIYEDQYASVPFWAKVIANFTDISTQCSDLNTTWEVLWWTLIDTDVSPNYLAYQTMNYNSSDNITTNKISSRYNFTIGWLSGWHYISFYMNTFDEDSLTSFNTQDANLRFYSYDENNTSVRLFKISYLNSQINSSYS